MAEREVRLTSATLDGPNRVTVRINRRVPTGDWPTSRFQLKTSDGVQLPLKSVDASGPRTDNSTTFILETAEPVDFVRYSLEVWVDGAGSRLVSVRDVLLDPKRYGDPRAQMGCTYTSEASTFRVFAPTAAVVEVVVADELKGDKGLVAHAMTGSNRGIWEATIPGDLDGKYYAYRLAGCGFDLRQEVGDIYATCAQGLRPRTLIVDLRKTDPPGFREHQYSNPESPVDAIVYEMQVRDFTISRDSGTTHRGKYLGLTEAGTHLPSDPSISTGLDHLVELGVTHVQIMPLADFDNHEDRDDEYHWGYMPVNFNSPDGWYASSVTGPSRIGELKQAIQAFHQRGIGVILDVVYNHTAKAAWFERLVPHYYYRKAPTDRYFNGSGCGNEIMTESPMARKFVIDSLKMWLQEYRVDGFRFDLLGLMDIDTVKQVETELRKIRPDVFLWGEPWTGGPTPLKPITDKYQLRGTGVASFNDQFRDAIKGERDDGSPGFMQGGERVDQIKQGLKGAIHDFAENPSASVNYFECHDNLTSWDKLLQSCPEMPDSILESMARLGATVLLGSQGITFLHSGQEFGRTKRGHSNSYNLPDAVNQIDWSLKKRRLGLFNYYCALIALRKAHPALRLRTRNEIEYRVWFGDVPNPKCIAYIIHSTDYPGEAAQAILLLYNGHCQSVDFCLGEGIFSVHASGEQASLDSLKTVQGCVPVAPHSAAMLCRYAAAKQA